MTNPVATCVVRWIYEQASWVLQKLKELLLLMITYIDMIIAILRAWLAQWDLLAKLEQFLWEQVEWFLEELMSLLDSLPLGPAGDICPEFVAYFTDPIVGLLESFTGSLKYLHGDLNSMLSYMDDIDRYLMYWENTKLDMVAAIDIIDAALYEALMNAAEDVPG